MRQAAAAALDAAVDLDIREMATPLACTVGDVTVIVLTLRSCYI